MAIKSILPLVFLLLCALFNTPIRGRPVVCEERDRIVKNGYSNSNTNASPNFLPLFAQNNQEYNHFSIWRTVPGDFRGTRANISVWSIPHVQPNSFSATIIAVVDELESVAAGFHVHPSLYNDHELHFHTYYNLDIGNSRGNYNTGFVVAKGANLLPGQIIKTPLSIINGVQHYVSLRIKKEITGDWSLYREDFGGLTSSGTLLGHWPKSLFKHLGDRSVSIQMGGVVAYPHDEKSPPMGSGHDPYDDGEQKAAWFKNVAVHDKDGYNVVLKFPDNMKWYQDNIHCYGISNLLDSNSGLTTYEFYYGGPGCNDDESKV